MSALEKQGRGGVRVSDFRPPGCEHARCSFHANYIVCGGRLEKLIHDGKLKIFPCTGMPFKTPAAVHHAEPYATGSLDCRQAFHGVSRKRQPGQTVGTVDPIPDRNLATGTDSPNHFSRPNPQPILPSPFERHQTGFNPKIG